MRRNNDILWKGITEEVFDDLLRFFFPQADEIIDFSRGFDFLDKELADMYPGPDKASDTRFVDKLVKVYKRDGKEEYFLVHIEVQGESKNRDRVLFAERMFRYFTRIFNRDQKPVTSIAIFTAGDGPKMPDKYEYEFLGTKLVYQYNTYCLTDPTDEQLVDSDNPFAQVILAARVALLVGKLSDSQLNDRKLLVAKNLLSKKMYSKEKIDAILSFLRNYVVLEDHEINRNFEDVIDQLTGKENTMGIIEQLAEQRAQQMEEKKNKEFVEGLLKKTDFSIERIADLTKTSVEFVLNVKNMVVA